MDSSPLTFTTLAIIVMLVIMLVMFACHYLGPRGTTWMRSNKEEKIGLSKNKLFHANGYMIHSGSEFLLSTSGSFKRFDTIDKDDYKQSGQHNHPTQQTTTPLWNLPQVDCNIPPQPLRPAPAPQAPGSAGSNHGKSVTFSFSKLNETTPTSEPSQEQHTMESQCNVSATNNGLVSCMRSSVKAMPVPQPIEAPPPPRLSASSSVILSASAIPRPIAKRTISLQNGVSPVIGGQELTNGGIEIHHENEAGTPSCGVTRPSHSKPITRRNSSTNPFLCESLESLTEKVEPNTALQTNTNNNNNNNNSKPISPKAKLVTTADIEQHGAIATDQSPPTTASINGNGSNPFHEEPTATSSPDDVSLLVLLTDEEELGSAREQQQQRQRQSIPNSNMKIFNFKNHIDTGTHTAARQVPQNNQQPRNRSFSETEASTETDLKNLSSKIALKLASSSSNPFAGLTQKVQKGPHMLQKTISEDFLFRKLGVMNPANGHHSPNANGTTTWSFGRSLLRQDSALSLGRRNSSQCSLDGSMDGINLERAISCDSVNSDSSVFLGELDQPYTQITGYLCVGLNYDKNSITYDGMELNVSVLEAKGLICPFSVESLDTFVRIYLVPDQAGAMQTKIFKNSQTPSYNESFNFWLRKQQGRHSLWFHLYHNGEAHTLIGEAEMEIGEMPRPITTWIPLSDSRKCNAQWGELMFSLSYLPTAERLTIVVVKARNLKLDTQSSKSLPQDIQNVFVKVYLMNNEKKVLKKRTSLKRKDRYPIFNESMIFSVPPQSLTTVQLRLTVFGVVDNTTIMPLGHVIAGSCATGKGLRHWHQMLSSLRKPVAMWHVLRRATNQPIFTGGAEAVVAAMQSTALRTKRNSII